MINRRNLLKLGAAALPVAILPNKTFVAVDAQEDIIREDAVKTDFVPEVSPVPAKTEVPFRTHYKIRIGDKTFELKNLVLPSINQEYEEWYGWSGKSYLYPGKLNYGDLSFRLSFDESNPEDMRKCHDLVNFFQFDSLSHKVERYSIDILLCRRDSVEVYATIQDAFFTSIMWDLDSGNLIYDFTCKVNDITYCFPVFEPRS